MNATERIEAMSCNAIMAVTALERACGRCEGLQLLDIINAQNYLARIIELASEAEVTTTITALDPQSLEWDRLKDYRQSLSEEHNIIIDMGKVAP